jgi:hypothetical protein
MISILSSHWRGEKEQQQREEEKVNPLTHHPPSLIDADG